MKRFSFLTLAIGATLIASAAPLERSASVNQLNKGSRANMLSELKIDLPARENSKPSRVIANFADMEGIYDWGFTTLLSTNPPTEMTIETVDETTGECLIKLGEIFEIIGVYNQTAGTLTIANGQFLGTDDFGDVYFYIKHPDGNGGVADGKADVEATVGTISGNVITFPQYDIWACGDPEDEAALWYFMTYENTFTKDESIGGDPNEGWTSIGNATLMDGWVLPAFGIDQFDKANWYEVELQQKNDNKMIYRLVEPYKGNSPIADFNTSNRIGYIQFDVTDPDHVTFATVDACFSNSQVGISKFYCSNVLSTLMLNNPEYSKAELIEFMGNDYIFTTFKDNAVTLGVRIEEEIFNDTRFGIQNSISGGYVWTDLDRLPYDMSSKIMFPGYTGVDVVCSDDEAAEVYYNLQGLRIDNPTKGQVVIVRKGNQASKSVVR